MTAMNRMAAAWQTQSLLLGYPDAEFVGRLDLLQEVVRTLDEPVSAPLRRFLQHVAHSSLADLAADYVATFDHRRRGCLYLTYYTYGDTRRRGAALLSLKQTYATAGLRLTDDELPDHLGVVLEYAACDPERGRRLLSNYRAGLELLRMALRDSGSPWADVLESVSATLPMRAGDEAAAGARLAAEGPPEEQVGLAPFGPPDYMPAMPMPPTQGVRR